MNQLFISVPVAIVLLVGSIGCNSEIDDSETYFGDSSPPEHNIYFGDPHVFLDDGVYYIYGTGRQSDTGIEVYQSEDLDNWEGPVGANDGFALHQDDVYGDHFFWAPEVYFLDGRYYMFFSVEEHMAIATSDSPTGPFVQEEESLLADFNAIDHHLFIDDDGTRYIYFAKFEDGLEIWGAEIEDDLSGIKEETMVQLLYQSQEWEKSQKEPVGVVNEGPEVVKKDGLYYMVYSANHYASPDYGIGLAWAEDPLGSWQKDDRNPVLQNPEGLVGTGHCMLFEGKDGKKYMSYHAHNSGEDVHPRKAYINPVQFTMLEGEGRYTLEVHDPRMELKYRPVPE